MLDVSLWLPFALSLFGGIKFNCSKAIRTTISVVPIALENESKLILLLTGPS